MSDPGVRLFGSVNLLDSQGNDVMADRKSLPTILAILAAHLGQEVSNAVLAQEIWPYSAPRDREVAIKLQMSYLRSWLQRAGFDPEVLREADDGYYLDAEPRQVDLHRFLHAAHQSARREMALGAAENVAEACEEALREFGSGALFRGADRSDLLLAEAEEAARVREEVLERLERSQELLLRRAWVPSHSGDLDPRDLAEASRLSDHLGRWVELLDDDDPRLPDAEATRDALVRELQLPQPRRLMLRAIVQSGLELLRAEVDELLAGVAGILGVDMEEASPLVPQDHSGGIGEVDPIAEEEWAESGDVVTDVADRAADVLPPDVTTGGESGGPDGAAESPGRGSLIVGFGQWLAKEGGSAVVKGAVVTLGPGIGTWAVLRGPTALRGVVEGLLNLVGL